MSKSGKFIELNIELVGGKILAMHRYVTFHHKVLYSTIWPFNEN